MAISIHKNQIANTFDGICVSCLFRFIGVAPEGMLLMDMECERCGMTGTIINTGETPENVRQLAEE